MLNKKIKLENKLKNSKGGKRVGSGRKKSPYQTKTIAFRVRLEWADEIKAMVKDKVKRLSKY